MHAVDCQRQKGPLNDCLRSRNRWSEIYRPRRTKKLTDRPEMTLRASEVSSLLMRTATLLHYDISAIDGQRLLVRIITTQTWNQLWCPTSRRKVSALRLVTFSSNWNIWDHDEHYAQHYIDSIQSSCNRAVIYAALQARGTSVAETVVDQSHIGSMMSQLLSTSAAAAAAVAASIEARNLQVGVALLLTAS